MTRIKHCTQKNSKQENSLKGLTKNIETGSLKGGTTCFLQSSYTIVLIPYSRQIFSLITYVMVLSHTMPVSDIFVGGK